MSIEQALSLAIILMQAASQAMATGKSTISLTSVLKDADDAARDELAAAIEMVNSQINIISE